MIIQNDSFLASLSALGNKYDLCDSSPGRVIAAGAEQRPIAMVWVQD